MYKTKIFLLAIGLVILALPLSTQAATYTVTKTADTADGTCDVSDCSLREAVIAANGGGADTINIPVGTYHFTRTTAGEDAASTGDLDLTDADLTTIIGAGSGIDDTVDTLVDPDDNDRGFHVTAGAAAAISNLTVLDGNLSAAGQRGAGILNAGTLSLDGVLVYGNTLQTASSTDGHGVGISCGGTNSALQITDSVINGNLGTSLSGFVLGGGIAIGADCDATLNNVQVINNAAYYGGGLYVLTNTNTVSLNDISVTGNTADLLGGGLYVEGADVANPVNISRALFQDNDANNAGGGVFAIAPLNVVNASFYGNHAGDAGGAFGTDSSTSPRINLAFVTMTRNTADSAAPGLYVGGATPDTHIKNSIVASNNHTADINDFEDCSGVPISDDYNYIAATASCDMIPAAHDIVGTDAGSVYFTATPIDDGGNVFVTALWETGVTLDMIPSASCTDGNGDPVTEDASGRSRPQNVRCDLGAYEKPDTATLTPTLISPTSSTSQKVLNLQYSLPETPSVATVTITNGSSITRVLTMNGSTSVNTTVNLASLASTTNVTGVAGGSSLPDGTYTVTLSYQDASGNTAATASATNVLIDTVTQTPTLTSPTSSSSGSSVHLQFTLPETPTTGSVTVTFAGSVTRILTMNDSTSIDTTVNLANLPATTGVTGTSGGTSLPDGTYTVTLSYRDGLANTANTASATLVIIDTTTQTPTLTSPTTGSANTVHLQYTLPEAPLTNTVRVIFTNTANAAVTTFDMLDNQSVNITFNPTDSGNVVNFSNVATIDQISPSPLPVLADGTYTVQLRYQDAYGNTIASTSATNVVIDTVTQAPVLTGPVSSSAAASIQLTYSLPETPQSDSVLVLLDDGTTTTLLSMDNTTSVNTTLNPTNLSLSAHVTLSNRATLADGTYTITLQYSDALGNPVEQVAATDVVLDRTAPVITLVGDDAVTIEEGSSYTDAGATALDGRDGDVSENIQVVNSVNTAVAGDYTVTYNVSDALGNAATQQTRTVTVQAAPDSVSAPSRVRSKSVKVTKRNGKRVLKWAAVDTATKYTVRIKEKTTRKLLKKNVIVTKHVLTKKWLDKHLVPGTKYRVQVKACNAAGCGSWNKGKAWTY